MSWVDERAAMAYELGAARFLLEHYFAGTANEHVQRETQAWLDRARGVTLTWSSGTRQPGGDGGSGEPDDCDQSDDSDNSDCDQSGRFGGSGPSQESPFDRLGE